MHFIKRPFLLLFTLLLLCLPALANSGEMTKIGKCVGTAGQVAEVSVVDFGNAKYLLISITNKGQGASFGLTKGEIPGMLDAGDKASNSSKVLKPGDSEHFGTIQERGSMLSFLRTNVKGKTATALALKSSSGTGIFVLTSTSWSELKSLIKQASRKL